MEQPQPRRGDEGLQAQGGKVPAAQQEPIKYGSAFPVKGELAGQPIAPRDAAAMRSAEDSVPGVQVPQESGGGFSAAAFMETAAAYNQAVGAVGTGQASEAVAKHGVNVTQDAVPGGRIVTEFVAGQVVGQYAVAEAPQQQQDAADHKAAGNEGGGGHGDGGGHGGRAGATAARRD
ncbi:late embryogenesis abundant protein D-34-like [Miscanthus floridulus]|uniref:late embryogenesis abundant protein D-34-like n=1 Tax=Miscanthus floridulus TaxID=154761 RepID=UPI003457682E